MCIQPLPPVQSHLHFWKLIPGQTLSLLSTWGLALVGPELVNLLSSQFLLWNKRMLWASHWLWANTSFYSSKEESCFWIQRLNISFLLSHLFPLNSSGCMKSCYHLQSAVCWNKASSLPYTPFQLPLKCVLGWLSLRQTNSWLGDHFLTSFSYSCAIPPSAA